MVSLKQNTKLKSSIHKDAIFIVLFLPKQLN